MNIIEFKTGMGPEAGKCYSGMPNEHYHSLKEWQSSSNLKNADRSLEYHILKKTQPQEPTLALERGSAFHSAFECLADTEDLSGFDQMVKTFDGKTIPSKKWGEAKAIYPNCYVVPVEVYESVQIMAEKAFRIAKRTDFFNSGYSELSFFWIDEKTGLKCKCRPDWINFDEKIILDYKSSKDHRPKEFAKSVANFGYHISQAFYQSGVSSLTGEDFDFFFIVVNSSAPFEVAFYSLKDLSIKEGEYKVEELLSKILKSEEEIIHEDIDLPFWAITKFDKEYGK